MTYWNFVQPIWDWTILKDTPGSSSVQVNEQFYSIQGEGHYTGTPAWFVRLQGCEVGCHWCDTKGTWSKSGTEWSVAEVVRGIPHSAKHVVITGGEPYEQDIKRLLTAIYRTGRTVQIETSGCYDVYGPGWITVSPKFFKPLSRVALRAACEIKQVIVSKSDVDKLITDVMPYIRSYVPVYLQPVSNGARALHICIDACKQHGFKLSVQTHKLLGIA